MLNETMNLKEMIAYRPSAADIKTCSPDASGIVKYIFVSPEAEENQELLRSMLEENPELFLPNPNAPFFDFRNPASQQSILIGCAECAAEETEMVLVLQEFLKVMGHEGRIVLDLFVMNPHHDGFSILRRIVSESGTVHQEVFEITKKA